MDVTLKSGAKLTITPADFEDANALRKSVLRSVRGLQLDQQLLDSEMNVASVMGNPNLATMLIDRVLSVATSDDVEAAVFRCAARCSYEGVLVTKDLFNDPKSGQRAREDFHQMFLEIAKANLSSFFKQTFSVLKAFTATPAAGQQ